MNKMYFALMIIGLVLTSCGREEDPAWQEQMNLWIV